MEETAMESAMASPLFSDALNFLALGISVVLLFAVAYLWSSNSSKSVELSRIQEELKKLKRTLAKVEAKVSELREPTVVSSVPQIDAFGMAPSASDNQSLLQSVWSEFVEGFNDLAEEMALPGQLKKCERFIRDNNLKILTYGGSMTFRPAIDAKDSNYWAFRCRGDEYAIVPNPMKPCDETLHEHGGLKELFALNYDSGVYRKYFVKLPALFTHDSGKGWILKNPGVVNLER